VVLVVVQVLLHSTPTTAHMAFSQKSGALPGY
jgi:hypothetical protein